MRQLTRGFTLIELMVTVTIAGLLLVAGLPAFADYIANSQLREGANQIVSGALFARSEAIKRNGSVMVTVTSQRLVIAQADGTPLRSLELPTRVRTSAFAATFDSTGRPSPFGTDIVVNVSANDRPCSSDLRCPAVHFEPGGAIVLCREGTC